MDNYSNQTGQTQLLKADSLQVLARIRQNSLENGLRLRSPGLKKTGINLMLPDIRTPAT